MHHAIQYGTSVTANHGIIAPGHAEIGDVRSATRQDTLIRCGNVGVGSDYRRHTTVEMPAHGNLITGGFSMKINQHHIYLILVLSQQSVYAGKR